MAFVWTMLVLLALVGLNSNGISGFNVARDAFDSVQNKILFAADDGQSAVDYLAIAISNENETETESTSTTTFTPMESTSTFETTTQMTTTSSTPTVPTTTASTAMTTTSTVATTVSTAPTTASTTTTTVSTTTTTTTWSKATTTASRTMSTKTPTTKKTPPTTRSTSTTVSTTTSEHEREKEDSHTLPPHPKTTEGIDMAVWLYPLVAGLIIIGALIAFGVFVYLRQKRQTEMVKSARERFAGGKDPRKSSIKSERKKSPDSGSSKAGSGKAK